MRIVVSNLAGHISGAVHFCGESFTRISEKALMGKHLETLCVNEYSNFSCEQNCAHVCAFSFSRCGMSRNVSETTALNFPQPLAPQAEKKAHHAPDPPPKIGHIQGYHGFVPHRSVCHA
jgi:hypothetical protein